MKTRDQPFRVCTRSSALPVLRLLPARADAPQAALE
jgi:hypothetical protein